MTEPIGEHERRIAGGALAQQAAQVVGILAMLVAVTILARRLSLAEFGLYGLVISVASYLNLAQLSVEGATVRAVAASADARERAEVFSTAVVLYSLIGVVAGLAVAGIGLVLAAVADLSGDLPARAREAAVALGVSMAIGWPFKPFQDMLRGRQRFGLSSAAECGAHLTFVAAIVVAVLLDGPFWLIAGLGGSVPILIGIWSGVVGVLSRDVPRFRLRQVSRARAVALARFGGGLGVISITELLSYTADRMLLAILRSATVVGLYEAAARPQTLVRQLHSTLVITAMPVASSYVAAGDDARLRELVVRGTRYVLGIVVVVCVILMVLAGPIVEVWLGPRFEPAVPALVIFVGYWLVSANTGAATGGLMARGDLRILTIYAWVAALLNFAIALVLTPLIGLLGPIIATAAQATLQFPWFLRITTSRLPVTVFDFAYRAWLPAYVTGLAVAALLIATRLAFDLASLPALIAASVAASALAAALWWFVWFDDGERRLILGLLRRG